jgi:hypothetical protein
MGRNTQAEHFAPSSRRFAPGEPRGKDEQNPEDHGGPVLRGRPKEVGRPSSGANVRPQPLESTRYTPALLNFGRELVVPNAVHRPTPGNAAADPLADTAADPPADTARR